MSERSQVWGREIERCGRDASVGNGKNFEKQARASKLLRYIFLFSYSTYSYDISYSTSGDVTLKSHRAIFLSDLLLIHYSIW